MALTKDMQDKVAAYWADRETDNGRADELLRHFVEINELLEGVSLCERDAPATYSIFVHAVNRYNEFLEMVTN